MRRKFLRKVAVALVGVVLFAQVAVAAYACPKLMPAGAATESSMTAPAMAEGEASQDSGSGIDCASMAAAPDASPLCAEHCRSGQQSDQTASVTVPTPALTALYSTLLPSQTGPAFLTAASSSGAVVAPSPPRTILHCRLLI